MSEPIDESTKTTTTTRMGGALRRELSARNLQRGSDFTHETTYGSTPSVVYAEDDAGTHGNFFPASYRRILRNAAWRARLNKAYTASSRIAHADSRSRRELDCAASSDALLMSIFCHPLALRSARLRALLGVRENTALQFGVRARIPLRDGHEDRTELDMVIGSVADDGEKLFVEAKLSESDFQTGRPDLMARYTAFEECFQTALLPRSRGHFRSYQLLRSVLAAHHHSARFAVLLDGRRGDLLEDTYLVYRAVQDASLRSRLHVITWQEIALCVGLPMQRFLAEKYGILPA